MPLTSGIEEMTVSPEILSVPAGVMFSCLASNMSWRKKRHFYENPQKTTGLHYQYISILFVDVTYSKNHFFVLSILIIYFNSS